MRRNILTALLYTLVTTVLFGVLYPFLVTGAAQMFFKDKANGQLIRENGVLVGSRLIGQPFSAAGYFHSRPSAAGAGYDAANSGGSNLGPTSQKLLDRMKTDAATAGADHPGSNIPVDLITASASGLDPDITPAAAEFQVSRVAAERKLTEQTVRETIQRHTKPRQWGVLGEPRVNVLELNLDLDHAAKTQEQK